MLKQQEELLLSPYLNFTIVVLQDHELRHRPEANKRWNEKNKEHRSYLSIQNYKLLSVSEIDQLSAELVNGNTLLFFKQQNNVISAFTSKWKESC